MITFNMTRPGPLLRLGGVLLLALAGAPALAQVAPARPTIQASQASQDNAIESITANQQGSNVVLNIAMTHAPARLPIGFLITNPPRIALDFGATVNATGKAAQDISQGDLRSINVVQAGERTRLVLNLKRALNYATTIDGKSVIVTVEGSGGAAQAVNSAGLPAAAAAPAGALPAGRQLLRDIDFKRGANGEGRIVVDLPNSQVAVDVRQVGNKVQVDFMKTGLPPPIPPTPLMPRPPS